LEILILKQLEEELQLILLHFVVQWQLLVVSFKLELEGLLLSGGQGITSEGEARLGSCQTENSSLAVVHP
jgi:hypothetical protein